MADKPRQPAKVLEPSRKPLKVPMRRASASQLAAIQGGTGTEAALFAARVEDGAAQLYETCRENAVFMNGMTCVTEADAAALLVCSHGHLKELRQSGKGPHFYRVPFNRSRFCYALRDLAEWIERNRDATDNEG